MTNTPRHTRPEGAGTGRAPFPASYPQPWRPAGASHTDPVGIVGGGLGGLASACVLAARGHQVVLWEQNATLGGAAGVLRRDGFRFDMGPTMLAMPRVLHRVLAETGYATADLLDLRRLDPQCRCFFDDGSVLDMTENMPAMRSSLGDFAPGSEDAYNELMGMAAGMRAAAEKFFFWRSVEAPRDILGQARQAGLTTLADFARLRPGSTLAGQIRRQVADPRVAQMLEHVMRHAGSSPFAAPAVLAGMAHVQMNEGIWYPIGGTAAVPAALEEVARALGVDIRTGLQARRILTADGQVTAVQTSDGAVQPVSAVVSNMDSTRTFRDLVGGAAETAFTRRWTREPSFSGVVLYLGLHRRYDHLLHHNVVLSRNAEEEFWSLHDLGETAPDPTCYLAAPACTEPGVAPPGGEALYVLVHTPYLRPHHDWQQMFAPYRRVILDKLKRTAGLRDIDSRIRCEHALTPRDFCARFGGQHGALYGMSSHGRLLGAFKPGNRSRDVKGLYLAGGSAHPGPGMATAMMSGWIAADALDADVGAELAAVT